MKKLIISIILVFISIYLLKYLIIPGVFITGFLSFYNRKIGTGIESISSYFKEVAISIDQTGNVICSGLFDITLIKKEGYKFGNPDETVSGVIGKNIKLNTLTKVGKILNFMLNKIEKNHSLKAIEQEENN